VIRHIPDPLVGEDLGVRLGLLDGLRVVGPAGGERGIPGVGEDRGPVVPAARKQPKSVNEDHGRLARCIRLVDLALFFSCDGPQGVPLCVVPRNRTKNEAEQTADGMSMTMV
jgi:hypothetical protein